MRIKRADVGAGHVDFADVSAGKRLPLIHRGEILRDDFLFPLKISVYTLAQAIKVPRSRVNDVVLGRRTSAPTQRFVSLAISAPRQISGSICKLATT